MTNAGTLGAAIGQFAAPYITNILSSSLAGNAALSSLENKIRSSGWVSGGWSIASELTPFSDVVSKAVASSVVSRLLSGLPDDAVPAIAHGILDKAIEDGGLSVFEGRIRFSKEELTSLKNILDKSFPIQSE